MSSTDQHEAEHHHPSLAQGASALATFVVGVVVAVQSRINGALGDATGSGLYAATISFLVGLAILAVVVAARPAGRAGLATLRVQVRTGVLPAWALLGGLAGATFVTAQSTTVTVLGVALFTVATVGGQTGMSVVVDRIGLGPSGALPVTVARVVAAVLATVAVAVASGDRWDDGSERAVGLVLLALLAGAAVAFQAAFNGRVSQASGQPTVAALVNFVVGLAGLLTALAVQQAVSGVAWGSVPDPGEDFWLYLGGPLGVVFVVTAAWSVRALGILLFSLVVIAGQLFGAVLLDLLTPAEGVSVSGWLVSGVVLTFVSVALAASSSQRART